MVVPEAIAASCVVCTRCCLVAVLCAVETLLLVLAIPCQVVEFPISSTL